MILQIKLQSSKPIIIPLHYKTALHGLFNRIFRMIGRSLLHNEGFKDGPRIFRLFTFSDIQERARRSGEMLAFKDEITVYFSSFDKNLCLDIARHMIEQRPRIGSSYFDNVTIGVADPQVTDRVIRVQTVSPIVTYETLHHASGKPYYNYFSTDHPSFAAAVHRNLIRKFNIIHPDNPLALPTNEVQKVDALSLLDDANYNSSGFEIHAFGKTKQVITYFKKFLIKGIQGEFLLKADPKLLQVALDCGLGSKNSQGFGMVMPQSDNKGVIKSEKIG